MIRCAFVWCVALAAFALVGCAPVPGTTYVLAPANGATPAAGEAQLAALNVSGRLSTMGVRGHAVQALPDGGLKAFLPSRDPAVLKEWTEVALAGGRMEFRAMAPDELDTKYAGKAAPAGYEWLPYRGGTAQALVQVWSEDGIPLDAVIDASVAPDQFGGNMVLFTFAPEYRDRVKAYTGSLIGRQMALVLDGVVQSAPIVRGAISDNGAIEGGQGGFELKEAQRLAAVLQAGALPYALMVKSSKKQTR